MSKRKKHKTGLITKLLIAVFAFYATATLLSLQMQINAKQGELDALNLETREQKVINAELKEMIERANTDEFYAAIARDKLGYVKRGERVFIDISST